MRHPNSLQVVRYSILSRGSHVFPRVLFLPIVALLLLLTHCGPASADSGDSRPHMARLSHVEGSVQVLRGDQREFDQAVSNMPLVEGSRLQTGQDGRAEVQFDNGSIARLTPNSTMSLNQIQRGLEGAAVTQIELLSGLGYFELHTRGGEDSLHFESYTITPVDGSATIRLDADAKPGELSVLDGKAHVTGGTLFAVDVHTDETIRFDVSDPARYYLVQGVSAESWDQWNSDRDQVLAQQALKRTESSQEAANSHNPGWGDLDQNGNWYPVPGYGNVWSPYGVGSGWDPYGSGYWGYYPGLGYMFISGYPWGWLPYRCGNWNYFDSFGWGWMPNNCGMGGMGWNQGGNIYIANRPRGYRPPPRPHPSRAVASDGPGRVTRVIRVDRGLQVSQIVPQQPDGSQQTKAIVVNGVVLHPLQPQPRSGNPPVGLTGLRPSRPTQPMPNPSAPVQQVMRPGGSSMRVPYNAPGRGETPSAIMPRNGAPVSPGMNPVPSPRTVTPAPSAPMHPYSPPPSAPPPHYSPPPMPSQSSGRTSSAPSNSAPSRR